MKVKLYPFSIENQEEHQEDPYVNDFDEFHDLEGPISPLEKNFDNENLKSEHDEEHQSGQSLPPLFFSLTILFFIDRKCEIKPSHPNP